MGTVAGYEVGRLLGRGSMGQVFRARPIAGGAEVALKRLPWAGDQLRVEHLRSEVAMLSRLGHRHVVNVVEVASDGNDLVIAMQLADRGSLAEGLESGIHLPVTDAAELVSKLAGAVGAAHAHGIVHSDVKPSNILFDAAGEPLLSDFGLVRHIASGPWSGGAGLGTAEYLDPAVAAGASPSPANDIYSLGVVCYELLAGRLPYRGATPLDTLRTAERGRLPPLAQTAPHAGARLAAVVEQAMARRPADRPSSAGELADAIRAAGAGDGPSSPRLDCHGSDRPVGPRPLRPRRQSRHPVTGGSVRIRPNRPLMVAAAIALVVVLALGSRLLPPSAGATSAADRCRANSPAAAQMKSAAGGVVMLADVDGHGCRVPVLWTPDVITVSHEGGRPPDRFALGQPGDVLLLGRWSCARATTPALYRPVTGEVFYFSRWAKPGRDLSPSQTDLTGVIDGTPRVVAAQGSGCDKVSVTP